MPIAKETHFEIDLGALEANYRYLISRIGPNTKFLAVVKAFAYGHDAVVVARKLETLGVDYLAVAYAQEGVALRDAGIKIPILVLHPSPANFKTIIARCLEPSLYSARMLSSFLETSEKEMQIHYPVHLKFNTGLNRLGFSESDTGYVQNCLQDQGFIKVASVFSHLAASEDPGAQEFTKKQIERFEAITERLFQNLPNKPIRHLANTSGLINYPEAHYDMVRSGIGLYGFGNQADADEKLLPIATLKTVISQIHTVATGESVGYNHGFVADKTCRIATLPIGHADGIGRHYGQGKGYVVIKGRKAPIVGNVCMDMMMVEISGINCEEGDEVIVFGREARADTLAETAGTISYELLTGISQRVKRIVLDNAKA
jgi:alanine racemase